MKYEDIPWKESIVKCRQYTVFKDGFPVTDGHILFVPRTETFSDLMACYSAAYQWGYGWIEEGYCDSFNLGQNVGAEAGQTVMWPHIHLIPRRKGDMEDPRGGVRHVIPNKGNYQKPEIEFVKIGEFLTGGQ